MTIKKFRGIFVLESLTETGAGIMLYLNGKQGQLAALNNAEFTNKDLSALMNLVGLKVIVKGTACEDGKRAEVLSIVPHKEENAAQETVPADIGTETIGEKTETEAEEYEKTESVNITEKTEVEEKTEESGADARPEPFDLLSLFGISEENPKREKKKKKKPSNAEVGRSSEEKPFSVLDEAVKAVNESGSLPKKLKDFLSAKDYKSFERYEPLESKEGTLYDEFLTAISTAFMVSQMPVKTFLEKGIVLDTAFVYASLMLYYTGIEDGMVQDPEGKLWKVGNMVTDFGTGYAAADWLKRMNAKKKFLPDGSENRFIAAVLTSGRQKKAVTDEEKVIRAVRRISVIFDRKEDE